MSLIVDKQTLEDLNLLGKYKPHSVYGLFNKVHTTGGERLMEAMFQHPLTDEKEINQRSSIFQYFEQKALTFPFSREQLGAMDDYLAGDGGGHILSSAAGILRKKLLGSLVRDEAYGLLYGGVLTVIGVLNTLTGFLAKLDEQGGEGAHPEMGGQPSAGESAYRLQARRLTDILGNSRLAWLANERDATQLPLVKVMRYDHLFRRVLFQEMEQLTQGIYQLDVYIAVSRVARERGFSYAKALPRENHVLTAAALSHPGINGAVANPVSLHMDSNMLFLTGANMAGKSTFMKAFGIAVYMAHMGFPVAAKEMVFSVRHGLYSSINIPDNLSQGYSHFYAEVLRVKDAATAVAEGKDLVVIFDELFKGTNVKDAYDATLAVTAAFAEYRNCFFIISTHIIEVGEALQRQCDNLQFVFLPTIMEGTVPRYTYKMEEGISSDRHGMLIIENEGILEIIQS